MESDDKTKRKRQKRLCKQIRDQMEFYFSDANLQKDRFLRKEIDQTEEGWLNLDMFTNFNKLKSLTTDMMLVAKALSTSDLIQVSEDGKQIKRKYEVTDAKDVDDRTVYVEHLPPEADHVWVKKVFGEFGRVVYVSLPRYRSTRDLKGFGFVEFQSKEMAERACKELNQSVQEEEKLGKFPSKHNKQMQELQKRVSAQKGTRRTRALSETEAMDIIAEDRKDALIKGTTGRKRRWSQGSNDLENGASEMKRSKLNKESFCSDASDDSSDSDYHPESEKKPEKPVQTGSSKDRKRKSSRNDGQEAGEKKLSKVEKNPEERDTDGKGDKEEVVADGKGEVAGAKKKKNRKKKKKVKEDSKDVPELRVIPKKQWLELRSEYLTLQKQSMKQLKQALQQISINPVDQSSNQEAGDRAVEMVDKENPVKKSKEPEFTPGVIVKIESTGPLNRKQIKGRIEKFGQVAYIDVLEGDTEAHVRCHSSEEAANIASAAVEGYTLAVVTGDSEQQYWEKLLADRTRKLSSKSRNKKRGKDKAVEKAGATKVPTESPSKKHIIFDDD